VVVVPGAPEPLSLFQTPHRTPSSSAAARFAAAPGVESRTVRSPVEFRPGWFKRGSRATRGKVQRSSRLQRFSIAPAFRPASETRSSMRVSDGDEAWRCGTLTPTLTLNLTLPYPNPDPDPNPNPDPDPKPCPQPAAATPLAHMASPSEPFTEERNSVRRVDFTSACRSPPPPAEPPHKCALVSRIMALRWG
jgi:hypothetical protein